MVIPQQTTDPRCHDITLSNVQLTETGTDAFRLSGDEGKISGRNEGSMA